MIYLDKTDLICVQSKDIDNVIVMINHFEMCDYDVVFILNGDTFVSTLKLNDYCAYDSIDFKNNYSRKKPDEVDDVLLMSNNGCVPIVEDGILKGACFANTIISRSEINKVAEIIDDINIDEFIKKIKEIKNNYNQMPIMYGDSSSVSKIKEKINGLISIISINSITDIKDNSIVIFLTAKGFKLFRKLNTINIIKYEILYHLYHNMLNESFFYNNYEKLFAYLNDMGVSYYICKIPELEDLKNVPQACVDRYNANSIINESVITTLIGHDHLDNINATFSQRNNVKVVNNGLHYQLMDVNDINYNVVCGKRVTIGHRDEQTNTIYMYGPCTVRGTFVSDENTIASKLQRVLNKKNISYNVENCGVGGGSDLINTYKYILSTPLRTGDVVLIIEEMPFLNDEYSGSSNYIDITDAFESQNGEELFLDKPAHCVQLVNERICSILTNRINFSIRKNNNPYISHIINLEKEMDLGLRNYLDFINNEKFITTPNDKIGVIEINANPVTYGHLYLISKALEVVDYLYLFLVSYDIDISYDIRKRMIDAVTSDNNRIKVLPCGDYLGSIEAFPEYFDKEANNMAVINPFKDIFVFSQLIVPLLGISFRFVGEENRDLITRQYNIQLKNILPRYGVELIEIPRKSNDNCIISAYEARKLIREKKWNELKMVMPDAAINVLREL